MQKCAFQGLKHTFMHVSGLLPPYFDKKKQFMSSCFLSIYGGVRPETCINLRFRA